MLDEPIFKPYYFPMSSDPYSEMTEQDHSDMCVWIAWVDNKWLDEPVRDDPGLRCNCEDYPCCGH